MKKRYLPLIALLIGCVLIVIFGNVYATYNHVYNLLPKREMGLQYNCQIELGTGFFTYVDQRELETRYLGSKRLVVPFVDPPKVKGIFITGWVAGLEGKMKEFIKLARETEINAFVIDIKDDTGTISYKSSVPLASQIKANRRKIKDIKALLEELKEENIYVIGRVVAFKDPMLAKVKMDRALQLKNTTNTWVDDEWIDPYLKENWEYVVALAREALELGFDEIQFDYVRFPALGNGPIQVTSENSSSKEEIINSFLTYAREELAAYGALISADIFGAVTSVDHDLGIGQNLETISNTVDVLSPMIYPSHYAHGVFNLPVPEAAPYETVYNSMYDAITRLTKDHPVRLRPWLQDFSLKYTYGVEEVREQIKALKDLGIDEWLLWNPRSRYTEAALLPEDGEKETFDSGDVIVLQGNSGNTVTIRKNTNSTDDTTVEETDFQNAHAHD